MNIFAIADLHLSLGESVDKPMDVFGSSWDDYERRLADNWRKLVEPEDLVLIPGDISWAMRLEDALPDLAWIDRLPGHKLILKGNHDLWWTGIGRMQGLFESITFMQHSAYAGEGFVVAGTRGWILPEDPAFTERDAAVYRRELLRLGMSIDAAKKELARTEGERPLLIGMTHYPPCSLIQPSSAFTDLFSAAGFDTVVYGHLHGQQAFAGAFEGELDGVRYRLCSLDRLSCVPMLVTRL
ncbi:MAG: metallophosphoesterase [Firmicutes bacterium]|nr:metallophosphoesterase [Bacillota bacterium]